MYLKYVSTQVISICINTYKHNIDIKYVSIHIETYQSQICTQYKLYEYGASINMNKYSCYISYMYQYIWRLYSVVYLEFRGCGCFKKVQTHIDTKNFNVLGQKIKVPNYLISFLGTFLTLYQFLYILHIIISNLQRI